MSKDMGFFVYLGYISGYVREIPRGRENRGQREREIQRSISSASSLPIPKIKQKIAAYQS